MVEDRVAAHLPDVPGTGSAMGQSCVEEHAAMIRVARSESM